MAPEIDMSKQRPAQYIFSEQVQKKLSEIRADEAAGALAKKDPDSRFDKGAQGAIEFAPASQRLANRNLPPEAKAPVPTKPERGFCFVLRVF